MIRSQKQLRSGGEAATAHHKMRRVKKLVQEKGGKAKLPWWSLSEGRISVGVDVVSRVAIEHSPRKEWGPRRKYPRGRNRPWERK